MRIGRSKLTEAQIKGLLFSQKLKLSAAKMHLGNIIKLIEEYNPLFGWALEENDKDIYWEAVSWHRDETDGEG